MTSVDPADVCAYCGEPVLTGGEAPEHPIPHALGASLAVSTVCAPCNRWANVHIDQPFLRDDWTRIHRAKYDVRDPRRPHAPVPHPLRRGFTAEGVRVTVDDEWRPHLHGRILEDPEDPDRVRIVAGSMEEAERLMAIVRERAAAEGKSCEIAGFERRKTRPRINVDLAVGPVIWLRAAAKMALGIASHVYPADWRSSADADHLRALMRAEDPRNEEGAKLGFLPPRIDDELLRWLAVPPAHLAWFMRGAGGRTNLFIVLFGELWIPAPVDTTGRPVPEVAWQLDPRRPRASGQTTWSRLMLDAIQRMEADDTAASEVAGGRDSNPG